MKKIKVGIASFGMSGKVFHAPLLAAHPEFELTAICERSKNEAAGLYPNTRIYKSFEELLNDKEIELVIVNTPDTTHYDFVRQALNAGKHVVVEKPFVFTVAEGLELIALAYEKSLLLTIFQNRRWDGDFLTVKSIIEQGLLGRVVEFRSSFQRFRNFIPPNTWKEAKNRYVGTTYNLGSHMIDQAICLFGLPKGVFARIATLRDNAEVDDYYHIMLIYPDIQVSLSAGYLMREETPRYTIHGTLGSFVKYGLDPQEEALKSGSIPGSTHWGEEPEANWGILHTEINGKVVRRKEKTIPGNYTTYYDNIADCLLRNGNPAVPAIENLKLIRVLEAAFQSQELNKVIFLE
ncbi:oxidoreductase [Parabacteroides sp. FAFU027]|uniref:oxidoreductase n=1 Tax=Parabacteroides sp. FAFU027 TaxID=2922715 RepID=UPI001FAEA4AF|nr:oxidoreductase [Parabacteroides sp. FAFU027]